MLWYPFCNILKWTTKMEISVVNWAKMAWKGTEMHYKKSLSVENNRYSLTSYCLPAYLFFLYWLPMKVQLTGSTFLAHLVMSLCNHTLSIVCHCHCHWRQCQWCQHRCWHLCTALPVIDLIVEALYLINTCSYVLNICTWNIKSI